MGEKGRNGYRRRKSIENTLMQRMEISWGFGSIQFSTTRGEMTTNFVMIVSETFKDSLDGQVMKLV